MCKCSIYKDYRYISWLEHYVDKFVLGVVDNVNCVSCFSKQFNNSLNLKNESTKWDRNAPTISIIYYVISYFIPFIN